MKCNVIPTSDGLNFALGWHSEGWYGLSKRPACNRKAVVVGTWFSARIETPYIVYVCADHLEDLIYLERELEIKRGWFKLVARIKDRSLEEEPALP
jgi:hypothetical protein